MHENELIPHLFRTEYRKIVTVLCKLFGLDHIEIAEDIASDTFLKATETWSIKGLPENPTAWLYAVAKNKARDLFKHDAVFKNKVSQALQSAHTTEWEEIEIDLSEQNISDSQLQMLFAICDPVINTDAQIGLALRILCGFGVNEIASAFLTNNDTINKRLARAKEKFRSNKVNIALPRESAIGERLGNVLTTLYLLFNEGYYSSSNDITLRRDLCLEAIRLVILLTDHPPTARPAVFALLSLMCFQSSRFDARISKEGEAILYYKQDRSLWNTELIQKGEYYLNLSSTGSVISKYHLEAGIAYWHTQQEESAMKWESILQLYNQLLLIEYSPVAALNRTYALSKANGKEQAIHEAEKLQLINNHFYHSLLGELYTGINTQKAADHFERAFVLAMSASEKSIIRDKISSLQHN